MKNIATLCGMLLLLGAGQVHGQEFWPSPLMLYGKATKSAESLATPNDRQIAALLENDAQHQSELATFVQQNANNAHVKQFASDLIKSNSTTVERLKRWENASSDPNRENLPGAEQLGQESDSLPWSQKNLAKVERAHETAIKNFIESSNSQFDENYLKIQVAQSNRQIDAYKALARSASPGFRNQLELLQEVAWNNSKKATELTKHLSEPAVAVARR